MLFRYDYGLFHRYDYGLFRYEQTTLVSYQGFYLLGLRRGVLGLQEQ